MKKPQPFQVKFGWDREKLAEYMLSRISYTAKPSTVSDDLGTDIFCTLFRVEEMNGHQRRLPLSSFAVQVRSSAKTSDFKNIQYLHGLEIPFFWGVLDESAKRLTLFSGENLHVFFRHVGEVTALKIRPLERNQMNAPYHPMKERQCEYTVMFPKVLHMDINQTREDLRKAVCKLQNICELMQGNISTSTMKEYIFEHYGRTTVTILAGSDSARHYLDNFLKRLAENFYNLEWLLPKNAREQLRKEFTIYEDTYLRIRELYPDKVFPYLRQVYERLKDRLNTEANISQIASTDRESNLRDS